MAGNIDSFVVDASYILASLIPDEKSPKSDTVIRSFLDGKINLYVPPIFNFEVLNGLAAARMRKRITTNECAYSAERFIKLGFTSSDINLLESFLLAGEYSLTVYDASYLWLAEENTIPLLTLDRKLERIAQARIKYKK